MNIFDFNENAQKSGVYQIRCLINNKIYVGSTVNFETRKKDHFKRLENNKHNRYFQNAFNKHGEDNFECEILEIIEDDIDTIRQREQYYMDYLKSHDRNFGYNLNKYANGGGAFGEDNPFYGKHHSDISKIKISESNKGKVLSEKTRLNMSKAKKGIKYSEERNRKLSIINTGKKHTEETKKKMSEHHTGKILSEKTKQKISKIKSGVKFSEEHKNKISMANKGKKRSKKQIEYMSESRKGKFIGENACHVKLSEEDVIKIKELLLKGIKQREIAEKFGVKQATISSIKHNRIWSHIKIA